MFQVGQIFFEYVFMIVPIRQASVDGLDVSLLSTCLPLCFLKAFELNSDFLRMMLACFSS